MQSTSGVSGAVKVLSPGIAEINGLRIDGGTIAWLGLVMYDCCIGACGGDRIEGKTDEVVLLSAEGLRSAEQHTNY